MSTESKKYTIGATFDSTKVKDDELPRLRQNIREQFEKFLGDERFERLMKSEGTLLITCQFMTIEEYKEKLKNG